MVLVHTFDFPDPDLPDLVAPSGVDGMTTTRLYDVDPSVDVIVIVERYERIGRSGPMRLQLAEIPEPWRDLTYRSLWLDTSNGI
ncbi:hypothetical protein SMNI109538_12590 [Smaragdicoccus niigatensis]